MSFVKLGGRSEIDAICGTCGLEHDRATRARVLGRMLPVSNLDVRLAWPCLFGHTRAITKAAADVGAVRLGDSWVREAA